MDEKKENPFWRVVLSAIVIGTFIISLINVGLYIRYQDRQETNVRIGKDTAILAEIADLKLSKALLEIRVTKNDIAISDNYMEVRETLKKLVDALEEIATSVTQLNNANNKGE